MGYKSQQRTKQFQENLKNKSNTAEIEIVKAFHDDLFTNVSTGFNSADAIQQPAQGLSKMLQFYYDIPVNRAAVDFKTMLAVGLGWKIEPIVENPRQEQLDKLSFLLENPNPDQSFQNISSRLFRDAYGGATGNGYLEGNRFLTEELNTIRYKKSHLFWKDRKRIGWLMKQGNQSIYFNRFGFIDEPNRSEVFHIKTDYEFHDWQGLPEVFSAFSDGEIQSALKTATKTYFAKGMMSQIVALSEGGEFEQKNMRKFQDFFSRNLFFPLSNSDFYI